MKFHELEVLAMQVWFPQPPGFALVREALAMSHASQGKRAQQLTKLGHAACSSMPDTFSPAREGSQIYS